MIRESYEDLDSLAAQEHRWLIAKQLRLNFNHSELLLTVVVEVKAEILFSIRQILHSESTRSSFGNNLRVVSGFLSRGFLPRFDSYVPLGLARIFLKHEINGNFANIRARLLIEKCFSR